MKHAFLAILLGLAHGVAFASAITPAATQEISHLFSYLKSSGCEFNRNGSWHSTDDAVAHLQKKYDYLLKKGLVSSAEEFIERAATESSVSGKPYQVRCGTGTPVASGQWFSEELFRFRKRSP